MPTRLPLSYAGGVSAAGFAIPYALSDGTHLFFLDFLAVLTDGRFGIRDTKGHGPTVLRRTKSLCRMRRRWLHTGRPGWPREPRLLAAWS